MRPASWLSKTCGFELASADDMDELLHKAATLQEALPYIRRFHGRTLVVKYGGHAMVDEALKESFAKDVCLLHFVGIRVVVVHGGGPQISEMLKKVGLKSRFSGGLRVTDDETMNVVEMVLSHINAEITSLICKHGGRALGLSGRDDQSMRAKRLDGVKTRSDSGRETVVDLGRVGTITEVSPRLLDELLRSGVVPVVAPIGVGEDGHALNVNADVAAGRLAGALTATKLLLMTDVNGVRNAAGELVRSLAATEAEKMIANDIISGGMIPKVRCALDAVAEGVEKAHIVDGRIRHALLLEILTDRGIGTEIKRLNEG